MKWVACLLLLGVTLRHTAANWLGETSYTPAAWFYMLGGWWELTLCAVLLWVFAGAKRTIWRDFAILATIIGMSEGMQVAVCRLAVLNMSAVPRGVNLCDWITGFPIGAVFVSLYLLILSYGLIKRK